MPGCESVIQLPAIIVFQIDALDGHFGLHVHQWTGEGQGSFQGFKFKRALTPRRIFGLWIGFARDHGK
jgi:hypothetical protein